MIQWRTDLTMALQEAKKANKKVFLLGSKEGCSICAYTKDQACESDNPPIRKLLEDCFVPVFEQKQATWGAYAKYDDYITGMPAYQSPLMLVIDPAIPNKYAAKQNGNIGVQKIYEFLQPYSCINQVTPNPTQSTTEKILIPYILKNNVWWSGLQILNHGKNEATIKIECFTDTGAPFVSQTIPATLNLPGGHAKQFLVDVPNGWAIITCPSTVAILEIMGDDKGSFLASTIKL